MVLYLGLNYLEQAVTARRNLLGKCLIVVPQHLDHVEPYLHKGKPPDEKYRFPWKRAKADEEFLTQESTKIVTESQKLATGDTKKLHIASFTSQQRKRNSNPAETINFHLECDVVPSSNPSTQDLFSPDDFFTEQNVFQETFEKENLKYFMSDCDYLKIESTENTDETLDETFLAVPDLSRLASNLKPVHVKDPFLQETGHPVSENYIFKNEEIGKKETEVSMLKKTYDADVFSEPVKQVHVLKAPKAELEDIVTFEPDFLGPDAINLMQSELIKSVREPSTVIVMDNEPDVRTVISKEVVKPEQVHWQAIENIDSVPDAAVTATFLDVNEIIITEQDRLCERAMLDSPVVGGSSVQDYTKQPLTLPGREKLEMTLSDMNFLDKGRKHSLMQKLWQSQKYCDEIQASRLPEPEFSGNIEQKEQAIKQTKRVLKVLVDTTLGNSDLELKWSIVKYTDEITDPCKAVAPFSKDNNHSEDKLKDVEKIDKYESRDMFDWQDSKIQLDLCEDTNTANIVQDRCVKPKEKTNPVVSTQVLKGNQMLADPLGDFMALRSKRTAVVAKNQIAGSTETIMPDETVPFCKEQAKEEIAKLKQNFQSKKRVKHHVVEVKISGDYQHVLDTLESASENCLNALKQAGEISQTFTFKSVTPDISRFLLKQKEKYLADSGEDGSSDDVYKMIVTLHGLVTAYEITKNCCLESAIGFLGALQEKYKGILGGSLDDLRQKMFEVKAQFSEKKIYHPKVVALCREIETWLKKKRAKTKDTEQKILILVKREMPSLLNCLNSALNLGNLLNPCILSSPESEGIIESLDKHNCMIAFTKMISENFPWAQFSLVVEFENEATSPWQQLCERQNIRHIELSVQSNEKQDTTHWTSEYPDKQIYLIGSQKVTRNSELLQLLETRHNILLLERDYSLIENAKHLYFSDIDVDANSAIVLEDIKDMNDDCVVQDMVTKMMALSLKYVNLWFILFSNSKNSSYQYPGHIISNIGRLQAAVANFTDRENDLKVKVLFCENCDEVSCLIRMISENCIAQNKSMHSWLERTWLSHEIKQEERFLLMLPCLSSYSSQLLLQSVPLKRILFSSAFDLSKVIPDISLRTLQTLEKLMSSSTGLHLRGEDVMDKGYCYEEEAATKVIEDNSYVSKTDIGELGDHYQQVARNDDVSADLYIPEDFQKDNERSNIQYKVDKEGQFSSENRLTPLEAQMKHETNDPIYKDTYCKNNFDYRTENQCISRKFNSKRCVGNTNVLSEIPNTTKTKFKEGNKNLTEWEQLNSFISSKRNLDGNELSDDVVNECFEISATTKENMSIARYLNPAKKLSLMRHRDMTDVSRAEKRYVDETDSQVNQQTEHGDQSIYFDVASKNDKKLTKVNNKDVQNNDIEYPKYVTCQGETSNSLDNNNASLSNTERNEYLGKDMYHRLQSRYPSRTGLPKETFDYNHGLPFQEEKTYDSNELEKLHHNATHNKMFRGTSTVSRNGSRDHLGYFKDCQVHNRRNELEREFPPSEEIDRSVSVYNNLIGREDTDDLKTKSSPKYHASNEHSHRRETIGENDNFKLVNDRESSYFPALTEQGYSQNDTALLQKDDSQINYETLQEGGQFLGNFDSQNVHFDFKPKMVDDFNCSKTKREFTDRNDRHDLILNPKLDRITQKQNVTVEEQKEVNHANHTLSLADDLRETTRKLLANSRQFSRFDTHFKRHPLQKVSIGLAQPRIRTSMTSSTKDLQISEDDQVIMAQSPWATDDSPPMDLEYDNSEINSILQNQHDTSNRVIYTNQTPRKKRKLTYQSVPGKGQTKLVFR